MGTPAVHIYWHVFFSLFSRKLYATNDIRVKYNRKAPKCPNNNKNRMHFPCNIIWNVHFKWTGLMYLLELVKRIEMFVCVRVLSIFIGKYNYNRNNNCNDTHSRLLNHICTSTQSLLDSSSISEFSDNLLCHHQPNFSLILT